MLNFGGCFLRSNYTVVVYVLPGGFVQKRFEFHKTQRKRKRGEAGRFDPKLHETSVLH